MAPPEVLINNSYSKQTHLLAGVGWPYPQSSSAPETTSKNWFFSTTWLSGHWLCNINGSDYEKNGAVTK
jgi:hypothetical protein